MVYYRKYRPQKIDDLDNAHVRETLTSVLKNPTTHAFLFTGPKGLGKTSTARIIAKAVNCTGRDTEHETSDTEEKKRVTSNMSPVTSVEPCNTCEQCVSITNGTHMDVLEIDAASNRGIDEIRELKEKIRLAPVSAKQKVYIIDEVHMLTTEAFNALLKTLEEPPSHAMFILCTTEPHKIPSTIISRCFHLNFKPATEEELIRSFKRIVEGEKIAIDDEALQYIASLSDRGFRDGVKVLEEVTLLAEGKKITKEFVEERYKTKNIAKYTQEMLFSLDKKSIKHALQLVTEVTDQGIDIKYFIQQLMEELHGELLIQVENGKSTYINMDIYELKILVELLSKAYQDMKFAVIPQLPLELAIIEYTTQSVIPSGQSVSRNLSQQSESNIQDPSHSFRMTKKEEGVTVSSLRKQVGTIKKIQALYGDKAKKDEEGKETVNTTGVELMHASPNGDVTEEWLSHFWQQLISEMKRHNHTIAGLLRGCTIARFDKKTLAIQTNYKFHKERLDDLKTRDALIKAAKLLTGNDVEVVVELKHVTGNR